MKTPSAPQLPKFNRSKGGYATLIVAALILAAVSMYLVPDYFSPDAGAKAVPLSSIQESFIGGQLTECLIKGNKITATTTAGDKLSSFKPSASRWEDLGFFNPANPIKCDTTDEEAGRFWTDLLSSLLPVIIIVGILFFIFRQAQGGAASAFSFGKSAARISDKDKNKTTFAEVAGADEAKQELVEIVDFLKSPKKYLKMGAKIPKGVLLVGPPGTGKTLLARAVAGEADVPFYSISGSEFVEMFVGVGASRVRDLFTKAKKTAPCIIFIDEIDAVGRQRGTGLGGGHDEREQTLNQILTEMDGFETGTNIIVMAATNRPDVLDPALLRPGRFDRRVHIDKPDIKQRIAILTVHSRNKPLANGINMEKIARQTPGFSGADLEHILNEAAILAAKKNAASITQDMLEESVEKVMMGPEKKSKKLSDEEKKTVAYHETGHAIVGHLMPAHDPIHKISIIARGLALGGTWHLPEADLHLYSKQKFEGELASLLGGRVAEELVFGPDKITTGASNDIERATAIARTMVTEYGMSDELGPITYGDKHGQVFIGKDMMAHQNYSEEIAKKIDSEVRRLIQVAYEMAHKTLSKHRKELEIIAMQLLKKETLVREEFVALFEGRPFDDNQASLLPEDGDVPPSPEPAPKPTKPRAKRLTTKRLTPAV